MDSTVALALIDALKAILLAAGVLYLRVLALKLQSGTIDAPPVDPVTFRPVNHRREVFVDDSHSYATLGVALDEIFAAATYDWCRHHRGGRPNEEAFAEAIQGLEVSLLMMPRGRVNVTVTISGFNGRNTEVNFWRLRRGPKSRLTLVGSSLDL